MNNLLFLNKIGKRFGEQQIFADLSVKFPSVGLFFIVGSSGCGKSTLLNIISGVDREFSGDVYIDDVDIKKLDHISMNNLRLSNIGYVFQSFNLLNLESSFENVALPIRFLSSINSHALERRVKDLLSFVGLSNKEKQKVTFLSGGEKQRVAIARALANNPKFILLDEPTGSLDEKTGIDILNLLKIVSTYTCAIVVSHDINLAKRYADRIYHLDNGQINLIFEAKTEIKEKKMLPSLKIKSSPKKPSFNIGFMFRHFVSLIKYKKWRTLISSLMTSLGLVGIGLTLLISSSISSQLKSAFSSVINDEQILVSLKNPNSNLFSNIYSTNTNEIEFIKSYCSEYINGYGVCYLTNFEDFFRTNNKFYISSTAYRHNLDEFSARNINEFVWIDDVKNYIYPSRLSMMENDQVVLQLSYKTLTNLCFQLNILRNYESFGQYLSEHDMTINLEVENSNWYYRDEQTFKVVGVCEGETSAILHSNPLWNTWVFEEKMRLPTTSNSDNVSYPWQLNKSYYVKSKVDSSLFSNFVLHDSHLDDYVFERAGESYYYNKDLNRNRFLVFYVDKNSIPLSQVDAMKRLEPELISYSALTDGGYSMFSSSLMTGFTNSFYISSSNDSLDIAIDADDKLKNNTDDIDLPSDVLCGNALKSATGGLTFSSNYGEFIVGNKPKSLDEIAISESISKKLSLFVDDLMFCSMNINGSLFQNELEGVYKKCTLKIVGVIKSNKDVIYHDDDWSISFFRDRLDVSSFLLLPRGIVFNISDASKSDQIIGKLNNAFSHYSFSNPSQEMGKTIDKTLQYVKTMFISFSIVAGVMSILLLSISIYLTIIDSEQEIILFKYLGVNELEIRKLFIFISLSISIISSLLATIEMLILNFLMSKFLSSYFLTSIPINFDIMPYIAVLTIALIVGYAIGFLSSIGLANRSKKINKKRLKIF